MDVQNVIGALDALFAREDFTGARTLLYAALEDARTRDDGTAAVSLYNEIMGFERQYGEDAAAEEAAAAALALLEKLDLAVSRPAAMVCLNAATVYKKAGRNDRAAVLYDRAETLFRRFYPADAPEFAGLYNNRASLYLDGGDYARAEYYYDRAARILQRTGGLCDLAVTYYNRAQLANAADPFSGETERLARLGMETMDEIPAGDRGAYYYYTCRKCAAAADGLGFFEDARRLRDRAEEFYERNRTV